jgi:hypothetical protein
LSHFSFTFDAAGFDDQLPNESPVGVGVVGFDPDGVFCLAAQAFWPPELKSRKDSKGASFGSKTVFLELIGLLLPFLLIPHVIRNHHVIAYVDNIGCYFGWSNGYVKNDVCASIIVRTIAILSAFLEVSVHVRHLPRLGSKSFFFSFFSANK